MAGESFAPGTAESPLARDGRANPVPATDAVLARISTQDAALHAFVDVDEAGARDCARRCDQGQFPDGALRGMPVAVKEVIDVRGLHCGWGTPNHADRIPDEDAPAVQALRAAGAVVVGTTASTEYAIAAAPATLNPHDPTRTPGGSSSGSAAAVAAGMVALALGSQTIGSIVRPATYCGVFGLKPTFGAISSRMAMPLSPWLDHIGMLGLHLDDMRRGCVALFQPDPYDPHSEKIAPPDVGALSRRARVFVAHGPLDHRAQEPSLAAVQRARTIFHEAELLDGDCELPEAAHAGEALIDTLLCRDMARVHQRDYATNSGAMSARVRGLIETGRQITTAQYDDAVVRRGELRDRLREQLQDDVWLAPAVDSVAPKREEGTGSPALQGLWTLCGFPVLAAPCGKFEGLPVGVQLIAAPGREDLLFGAAAVLTEGIASSFS
jgi:Asp-tRNA(Asn)/Glu-tRNA(Gln) amidotransferase A subunit family amidase